MTFIRFPKGNPPPILFKTPDRSGSSVAIASPDVIKTKPLQTRVLRWDLLLSLLASLRECGPGPLRSAQEGQCRSSSTSQDFAQIEAFPYWNRGGGRSQPCFGFRCLVMQSGPLRALQLTDRKERRGVRIFVECQKLGIS